MKKIIISIFAMLLLLTSCGKSQNDFVLKSNQVIDKIENKETFLLYITSETCPACQLYDPVYQEVNEDYPNLLFKLDYIDESENNKEVFDELVKNHIGSIKATPTTFVVIEGEVKESYLGMLKYSELENTLINFKLID